MPELEDKLTHDERIRLESVAQANLFLRHQLGMVSDLIDTAAQIERYIRNDPMPGPAGDSV